MYLYVNVRIAIFTVTVTRLVIGLRLLAYIHMLTFSFDRSIEVTFKTLGRTIRKSMTVSKFLKNILNFDIYRDIV